MRPLLQEPKVAHLERLESGRSSDRKVIRPTCRFALDFGRHMAVSVQDECDHVVTNDQLW